jgi:hypothetical protein
VRSRVRECHIDPVPAGQARVRPDLAGSLSLSDLDGLGGIVRKSDPGHSQVLQAYDEAAVAPVAGLMQDSGDFLHVFERWSAWKGAESEGTGSKGDGDCGAAETVGSAAPYYNRSEFLRDFVDFARSTYIPEMAKEPELIRVLTQVEDGRARQLELGIGDQRDNGTSNLITYTSVPFRLSVIKEEELEWDYEELIGCLRSGSALSNVTRRRVTVLFKAVGEGGYEVRQLPPLLAQLWALCDGNTTVKELVEIFVERGIGTEGIPAGKACVFGLKSLVEDGLLGLSTRPASQECAADEAA